MSVASFEGIVEDVTFLELLVFFFLQVVALAQGETWASWDSAAVKHTHNRCLSPQLGKHSQSLLERVEGITRCLIKDNVLAT